MEMATKNSTPFLHQDLYRMYTPQCIVSVNNHLFQFFRCLHYRGSESSTGLRHA